MSRSDGLMESPAPASARGRLGRPPATSRGELARVGILLFTSRGFDATSVDDIADAAGVSRRTFFRYFAAKADVVWGEFDEAVERMRADLASTPDDVPLMEAVRVAVVRFNHVPAREVVHHRQRMRLIFEVPEIISRSPLWYATWRRAIDEFAATRLDQAPGSLLPRTIGYCALGAATAAYEQWLSEEDASLAYLLERSFRALAIGFGADGEGALAADRNPAG